MIKEIRLQCKRDKTTMMSSFSNTVCGGFEFGGGDVRHVGERGLVITS
jgi:hypothetical protein